MDKRRNAQTKEIVAYRLLLSVNKFCRKTEEKKKDSNHCYMWCWFSHVTTNTAMPELALSCQTASVLAVAWKSSSFKLMLTVKNILKPLEEQVCQLFYSQYYVHLSIFSLNSLSVLLLQSYLPPMKSVNSTWINTTQMLWFQFAFQSSQTCK